jgi:hypothetical protein
MERGRNGRECVGVKRRKKVFENYDTPLLRERERESALRI